MRFMIVALSLMSLLGCGGGNGSLVQDAAVAGDAYVALDLTTGRFAGVGSDGTALAAEPRFRTTHILFRRVRSGTGELGCQGFITQGNETNLQTVAYNEYFCAVFEVTQDQWTHLAGTTPWTSDIFLGAFTDRSLLVGPSLPAWGICYDEAAAAAATWTRDGWQVSLPTAQQWEIACRAGTNNKLFPWGNAIADLAVPRAQAVFWEVNGTTPLPRAVGDDRTPNAWGLYDMIGNIGELTQPQSGGVASLRGGAYDQPLVVCRASHVVPVPSDLAVPVAGVRLILQRTAR